MKTDQIHQNLITLFDRAFTTEDEAANEVAKLIQEGANPNFMIREPNHFLYPVSAAANRGWHRAIELLLDAGGRVHWPTDEVDIDQDELSGHEDEPYKGYPCDPLGCAMDSLAWWLVEYDLRNHPNEAQNLHQTIRMLIERGADPNRIDPATAKTSVQTMMITLNDNYHNAPIQPKEAELIADILMLTLSQKTKARQLCNIAAGDFSKFNDLNTKFFEAQPHISGAMVSIAEKALLSDATHKPSSFSRKYKRL